MKIVLAAALLTFGLTQYALASGTTLFSFRGHWHVDLKRSVFPPEWHTESVTLNVTTDDGELYEEDETEVKLDGTSRTTAMHVPVDGKFHSVQSSVGESVAITKRAGGFMRLAISEPDGSTSVETCKMSSDRNSIACDVLFSDLRGTKHFGRSVYVRDNP